MVASVHSATISSVNRSEGTREGKNLAGLGLVALIGGKYSYLLNAVQRYKNTPHQGKQIVYNAGSSTIKNSPYITEQTHNGVPVLVQDVVPQTYGIDDYNTPQAGVPLYFENVQEYGVPNLPHNL